MIGELAERIWSHEQFHREAGELRSYALRTRYVPSSKATHDVEMLLRLLRSAAVLAASRTRTHRELAFQIATAASEISDGLDGIAYILLLVLSRLGNFPALNFAKRRFSISEEGLPVRMVAEASTRTESNSIRLRESSIALTDFQRELWDALITGDSIGVSAPTSAGKSYVLQTYARKLLSEQQVDNIAFLVPTRALINQVADEVSQWLRSDGIEAELVTTPIPRDSALPARAAYVVTQERMQLLQSAHPHLAFGAILIDEAQSLADGPRGVLLSSVIEDALNRNPKTQLLFAGPNLRDPGKLSILFGKRARSVVTDEATVVQNIIFVDCDEERPKSAEISFLAEKQRVLLGTIECDQPLTDHRSKLVNLALRLGGGGQNLIYALGPAECENIAFGLADGDPKVESPELEDLSSFIKEAVHPKYQLAVNVLQKVGFHYGRLPSLVRKAIEDAFAQGHLQFLVTTSTLLYGVNLPAQNLFLHNPQKGKNQPISPIDFWNLAGRAGRLGKEFTGNVFLIDYGQWPNDPMSGERIKLCCPRSKITSQGGPTN
ncbi:DEAD/DEAH box helicase [Bradyrhizobium liaoningense]|uniref:DEAD/DEAH box helicase n=1 Tax=Bradyrhizobium liaoningense TaxID=43992 RepID=UPI001FE4A2D8|nr:DEAD/DEAH box helicase [Bradyrhizobium liaoningense]